MDPRRLPLVMQVLAGVSVFILVASLATLVLRGGGGTGKPSAVTPTTTASAPASAAVTPTASATVPPLAFAAKPKVLHGLKPGAASPGNLSGALSGLLTVSTLGSGVSAEVVDVLTGQPLFSQAATVPVPPASAAKLATAAAALTVLGPNAVLSTTVRPGASASQIVLVGGGDPTLAGVAADPAGTYPVAASLAGLAKATAKALVGRGLHTVSIAYDSTLYSGPASAEGWKPSYFSAGNVAPVSALEVDEGRRADKSVLSRSADPAQAAAQQFATLLGKDGVKVTGTVIPGIPSAGGKPLAKVTSAPVSALVERMLRVSDNDLAESLARQVALKEHLPATFPGAAQAIIQADTKLGVDASSFHMVDGSGLSTADTLQTTALTALVRAAASPKHPELRALLAGLPVAGFLGTLSTRFTTSASAAGIGAVRAKTGTLTNVSSLAGVVVDADGRQLAFALIAGHVPSSSPLAAEAALDRVAAAIAGCGCH
jgi:serine-type D-Ala-D-Ala carboxypeptidase/endopeptidase (penicillin-binding protein 4)